MRTWDQDEGDASVPTLHNPSPAPTGMKALPRRHPSRSIVIFWFRLPRTLHVRDSLPT